MEKPLILLDLLVILQTERDALQSQLKERQDQIASLEKLNHSYIEQLKLRQKKKFLRSSQKAGEGQMSVLD